MKTTINITKERLLPIFFFLSMTISVWAVRTPHSTLGPDWLRIVLSGIYYCLLIAECTLSLLLYRNGRFNTNVFFATLCPVIYWIYIHAWAYEMESFAITSPIIACIFALQNDVIKKNVYVLFRSLIVIVSAIAILCYFAYILKLKIPYTVSPYYDGRLYQNYVNYFNISFLYITSTQTRVCGIFNEPGWLGTTLGLLLCYEKFDIKKLPNWIMLLAGLLTYSLAFILIVAVGFIVRNIKYVKKWGAIIAFICIALFVIPHIETSNPQINRLISRLEFTQNGLKGNNRSSASVDKLLQETITSKKAFFGYGDGYAEYYNSIKEKKQVLTIKTEVINFGIIGTVLLYLFPLVIFLIIGRNNKKALIFIICFWISLYQRPWLYIVSNYMLLLAVISYLNIQKTEEEWLYSSSSTKEIALNNNEFSESNLKQE